MCYYVTAQHLHQGLTHLPARPESVLATTIDLSPNERLNRMLDRLNEEREQAEQRRQKH